MKRIGITQRAHTIPGFSERRDMLDQRWARLVERLGACPVPLANAVRDTSSYLDALGIEGLILTGGNDIAAQPDASDPAPERDLFESEAFSYCLKRGLPVLGICRGAQMINHLAGGRLEKMPNHVASRHVIIWSNGLADVWDRLTEVNSYHNWAIPADGLGSGLLAAGRAEDGSIEAFYAKDIAVTGIVWHPERENRLSDKTMAFLAQALGLDPSNLEKAE